MKRSEFGACRARAKSLALPPCVVSPPLPSPREHEPAVELVLPEPRLKRTGRRCGSRLTGNGGDDAQAPAALSVPRRLRPSISVCSGVKGAVSTPSHVRSKHLMLYVTMLLCVGTPGQATASAAAPQPGPLPRRRLCVAWGTSTTMRQTSPTAVRTGCRQLPAMEPHPQRANNFGRPMVTRGSPDPASPSPCPPIPDGCARCAKWVASSATCSHGFD